MVSPRARAVIVRTAAECASSKLIEDCRPRRMNIACEGDRSAFLARRLHDALLTSPADGGVDRSSARVGSSFSISKPGLEGLLSALDRGGVTDRVWREYISNRPFAAGITGPAVNSISACATGLFSIVRAARMLEDDECDLVVAGAAEASLHPFVVGGFSAMGVLSTTRPRPFDRRRDGFVPSEGGAAFLLCRDRDARASGGGAKAGILGWATAASDSSAFAANGNADSIADMIRLALARAALAPRDVSYIHLHGTATRQNDISESSAVASVFAGVAVPASSTKALTGHCLGAAGAVEAALTIDALRAGTAPPNYGLEESDPACACEQLITRETPLDGRIALILSYGFGGQMAALVIEAYPA